MSQLPMSRLLEAPSASAAVGPIAAVGRAPDGTRLVVLLPDLDTLLGAAGFDRAGPAIRVPRSDVPIDGWALFGPREARVLGPLAQLFLVH